MNNSKNWNMQEYIILEIKVKIFLIRTIKEI